MCRVIIFTKDLEKCATVQSDAAYAVWNAKDTS